MEESVACNIFGLPCGWVWFEAFSVLLDVASITCYGFKKFGGVEYEVDWFVNERWSDFIFIRGGRWN